MDDGVIIGTPLSWQIGAPDERPARRHFAQDGRHFIAGYQPRDDAARFAVVALLVIGDYFDLFPVDAAGFVHFFDRQLNAVIRRVPNVASEPVIEA